MTFSRLFFRRCSLTAVWLWSLSSALGVSAMQENIAFPVATPESQGIASAAVRRVADEVQKYCSDGVIVGGELLIIKNRKTILHEVYGERDRENKQLLERNSIFNIRSMTKPLTGVAVQMLVDEGKLFLNDPVAKYLPGFDNEKSQQITIEQLLQHRGGLPLTILSVKMDEYASLQDQAQAVGEKGPQFPPGERFWYSDAGSDAAAAVVEKISGKTIDQFIGERILRPLQMNDSFYLLSTDPASAEDPRKSRICNLYFGSQGFWYKAWTPVGKPFYPFAWGSQSLYSTPQDYARFLSMWLDGGIVDGKRMLSAASMDRILTPASTMKELGGDKPYPCGFFGMQPHYGQMSMLYAPGETPARADVVAFGHDGSDGTGAWAFPAEDLIVCYFTQSRGQISTIRIATTIQDALICGQDAGQVPVEMQPLLGTYYATIGRLKAAPFRIVYRCGKLALDIPSELVYELMEPDAEGRWKLVANQTNAITFKKDDAGKVLSMVLHKPQQSFEMPREKPED